MKFVIGALILMNVSWANASDESYFRFWRGFKKAEIQTEYFHLQLGSKFVPATVDINAGKGLIAYAIVTPPQQKPNFIPDELALVTYETEAVYRAQRATPEGQRYSDMHWEIFDRATSKSEVPLKFYDIKPAVISPNVAYDMINKKTNWQEGYLTFYIGLRRADVSPQNFLIRMTTHVQTTQQTLARFGLEGYLM